MWNSSLKTDIIVDEICDILSTDDTDNKSLVSKLKEQFFSLSDDKIDDLAMIVRRLVQKNKGDSVEVVSTNPMSFNTKNRKTYPVIEETILSAKGSITLTGYSVSDHFDEMIKLINQKSKQGIEVELYLNDYQTVKDLLCELDIENNSFFRIYNYTGELGDGLASLHAKTLIVDEQKLLVTSANLSYHGMIGNIEIGVLIDSKSKASQVLDILRDLKRTKKFKQINQ